MFNKLKELISKILPRKKVQDNNKILGVLKEKEQKDWVLLDCDTDTENEEFNIWEDEQQYIKLLNRLEKKDKNESKPKHKKKVKQYKIDRKAKQKERTLTMNNKRRRNRQTEPFKKHKWE